MEPRSLRPVHEDVGAVIVGAGFAGLYMLHKLRLMGLSAKVIEAGAGVGGTWYWNRYPGARVDIESQEYSYSFSPELEREWVWPERYSAQPELRRYLNHVADRFDLRRDIDFNRCVTSAVFDEARAGWTLTTDDGTQCKARFCIMATGCLSVPSEPEIPGQEMYGGRVYHTARWPEQGVDFSGLRVGVIGTGSSGIQSIPYIAAEADHLYVFQRTPNFSVPAHNCPADPVKAAAWKEKLAENRAMQRQSRTGILASDPSPRSALEASEEERRAVLEDRWSRGGFALNGAFSDIIRDRAANDIIAAFVADKIRATVNDPAVAERLVPKSFPYGAKRVCVDTDYYKTFNRQNVTLVDISEGPIETFTGEGLSTSTANYDLDAIVFATGFDAMTGALNRIDIRGRSGISLRSAWVEGPQTYLGLMIAGFPNLFTVTGPGSPSVVSNMVMSIEQHVEWIADCLRYVDAQGKDIIEAEGGAQDSWVTHVNEVAAATLLPQASSWYLGANIPGKPRVFMPYIGGADVYRKHCEDVAAGGYTGFLLSSSLTPAPAESLNSGEPNIHALQSKQQLSPMGVPSAPGGVGHESRADKGQRRQ